MSQYKYIKWFDEVCKDDIASVGGKGANLGELTEMGLDVPPGFCVTAQAYDAFIGYAELDDIVKVLVGPLDVDNVEELTNVSNEIQAKINESNVFPDIEEEIVRAYREFSVKVGVNNPEVAVRSSATAEDLPDASFAGQQDTFLHVSGVENVIDYVRKCWASLFEARAIFYREENDFDHSKVLIAVVVQKMANADKAGVMFTVNPSTGEEIALIEGSSPRASCVGVGH